jgi:hypothetical protein
MIDEWKTRVHSEPYDLPDLIEIRPTNFNNSIPNADRIDQIIAGYMAAGLFYIVRAETNIRVMLDNNPAQHAASPLAMGASIDTRKRFQERALGDLDVARFKLDEARTRLYALGV